MQVSGVADDLERMKVMSEKNQGTSAGISRRDGRGSAARSVFGRFTKPLRLLAMLATAGSVVGISLQATAAPSGTPQANRIFFNCTFTTAGLRSILTIPQNALNALAGKQVQASYIIIYVRQSPNDGQRLGTTSSYTGPILCTNSDTEDVVQTTETTAIPNPTNHPGAASVDILGIEEALHLQYQLNLTSGPGDIEKRVCHTAAANTDCFFIQPK
jgi:hypothetical protein